MVKKHPIRPHLHAWRKAVGKTAQWLANELGTSHSTVLRYESGETGVDDDTFAAIATAYGITLAELSSAPRDASKAQALDRLMTAVRDMDEETLQTLAGLAERLHPKRR